MAGIDSRAFDYLIVDPEVNKNYRTKEGLLFVVDLVIILSRDDCEKVINDSLELNATVLSRRRYKCFKYRPIRHFTLQMACQ